MFARTVTTRCTAGDAVRVPAYDSKLSMYPYHRRVAGH